MELPIEKALQALHDLRFKVHLPLAQPETLIRTTCTSNPKT